MLAALKRPDATVIQPPASPQCPRRHPAESTKQDTRARSAGAQSFLWSARIASRARRGWEEPMVQIGDRVVLESEKVGQQSQSGVVTGTQGRLLHVRWDSGKESSFIPSAGSLQVIGYGSEGQSERR